MSDKCETCIHELDGDGGCAYPCNLCTENDGIQFILNHPNERAIILMMCASMHINLEQLKLNKKYILN
jgi:galactose-1-phosphate uridylyltransferase